MKLKLITFDATNTLLRIRGSVGDHYAAVANKYYGATKKLVDKDRTEIEFIRAYKEVSRLMPNFGYDKGVSSENWWHEVVHRVFFSLGLRDISVLKSISNQLYTDYCSKDKYELFPEVNLVLSRLKKYGDIKLGVISNFDERLELLLEQLKIREYFDLVLCSRLLGMAKPAPEVFLSALHVSGVETPSEALHIGDNLELDYVAAKKAGLNALLVRRGESNDSNALREQSISVVDSLEGVFTFIEREEDEMKTRS